uniref:RNA polymerase sigma-54 factor RpoN n=1 Tax=uncultured bacterium contig00011 TaxID=1181503 RepID=A0A806KJ00_9BACT|nr:RNA polymerase sigma-54 factor RpoN [uncultured bacterium contig00011]
MQFQRQSFIQEQRLKMNPQLLQSIKLMELPVIDLRERIEQELESNPALEITEDQSTVRLEEHLKLKTFPGEGRHGSGKTSEEHRRFIEGALTRPETLQEHLLWQLQLEPVDEELRSIAEMLIQNLNDDGFHIEKPENLFKHITPRLAEAVNLVRTLEPAGTCTSDYKESLKVQAALINGQDNLFSCEAVGKVLDNLELLEKEKFSSLAKKTGIEEEELRLICEFIKKLSPFPGRSFAPADTRYVIPDVRVVRDKDEFNIILNDESFPILGINPFFEKLSGSKTLSDKDSREAKNFARENVREARLFINHLEQRNKTLIRVTAAILEFQRSFFINGPKYLAPLTLRDIARELDVHETTVSRIANGKYMQTEWGIYKIRHFFTNSISGAGSSGSRYSKESVKEIIREIITAEKRLLSDQDICDQLSQKGIALARRTVAKYRNELDMGSSYARKIRK